jgi:tetratricopeptide (TPR) repeat protein
MKAIVRTLDVGPPYARKLARHLRAMTSRIANDMAILMENLSKPEQAVGLYRSAFEVDSQNLIARMNLLALLQDLGRRDDAEAIKLDVDRALAKRDPRVPLQSLVAQYGYVRRKESMGMLTPRPAAEDRAKAAPPELVAVLRRIQKGEMAGARADLEKFVQAQPGVDHGWILLGMLAYRAGDQETVQRSIAVMGRMALDRNDKVSAREYFEKSLKLWPANAEVMEELLKLLLEDKDWARVEALVHDLLLVDPNNMTGNFALGTLLNARGEPDLARDAFLRVVERSPVPAALNNLAWLALERGEADEALELVQRSLSSSDNTAYAWHTLGVILAKQGRREEAERAFRRAIDLAPTGLDARVDLVLLHADMGRGADASAEAAELLANQPGLTVEQRQKLQQLRGKNAP